MDYQQKYLKYKQKYLTAKQLYGGSDVPKEEQNPKVNDYYLKNGNSKKQIDKNINDYQFNIVIPGRDGDTDPNTNSISSRDLKEIYDALSAQNLNPLSKTAFKLLVQYNCIKGDNYSLDPRDDLMYKNVFILPDFNLSLNKNRETMKNLYEKIRYNVIIDFMKENNVIQ